MTEEQKLIDRIKQQVDDLWKTIQEAKQSNLNIKVEFGDNYIRPELKVFKELY